MQPYFFPYIGYFQLIKSVDLFVVYDNIKYTKKGWINRNRFLQNGKDADFAIPLKKNSDFLDVRDRAISPVFDKKKLLNKIREAYRKAPYFSKTLQLFERVLNNNEVNLFNYINFSIREVCKELGIKTEIIVSSTVGIDHSLKSQEKVIAICKNLCTDVYVNAIGGRELYSVDTFKKQGVDLKFIKTKPIEYKQFGNEFVPWLSIIDVMMFNNPTEISRLLDQYELI